MGNFQYTNYNQQNITNIEDMHLQFNKDTKYVLSINKKYINFYFEDVLYRYQSYFNAVINLKICITVFFKIQLNEKAKNVCKIFIRGNIKKTKLHF